MSDIAGFPPEAVGLILLVSVAYFLVGWAPIIWPVIATHRLRRTFPRRWLFVLTILSLAYGAIIALLTLFTIPVTAYSVFIAPQLSADGFHGTDWLVSANSFVVAYWWLALPPLLLLNTFLLVRKLLPAWPAICTALTANNSFKPNPHQGGA
jgi:uncharacterized PurR-regulated membrane protein YhhQ (DUF165 family)